MTKGASIVFNQCLDIIMLFLLEMAFILDSDLSILGKHCRLCCTTAVCEDIWKKFAFEDIEVYATAPVFPTPPVSPRLSPEPVSDSEEERCCLEEITRSLFYDYDEEDEKDEKQQPEELESQNLFRSMLINQVRIVCHPIYVH